MAKNFDLDRGVIIKRDNASGMYIGMYVDEPGVYLDQQGRKADKLARKVGFDVDKYAKMRQKAQALAKFKASLDKDDELAEAQTEDKVLATRGGFSVVGLPLGRAKVIDSDGEKVNSKPMSVEEATKLVDQLVQEEEEISNGGTSA